MIAEGRVGEGARRATRIANSVRPRARRRTPCVRRRRAGPAIRTRELPATSATAKATTRASVHVSRAGPAARACAMASGRSRGARHAIQRNRDPAGLAYSGWHTGQSSRRASPGDHRAITDSPADRGRRPRHGRPVGRQGQLGAAADPRRAAAARADPTSRSSRSTSTPATRATSTTLIAQPARRAAGSAHRAHRPSAR